MGIIGNSRQASKSWLNPSESETRKETSFTEQNIPLMRNIKQKSFYLPGSEGNGYLARLLNLGSCERGKNTGIVTWLGQVFLSAAPTSY